MAPDPDFQATDPEALKNVELLLKHEMLEALAACAEMVFQGVEPPTDSNASLMVLVSPEQGECFHKGTGMTSGIVCLTEGFLERKKLSTGCLSIEDVTAATEFFKHGPREQKVSAYWASQYLVHHAERTFLKAETPTKGLYCGILTLNLVELWNFIAPPIDHVMIAMPHVHKEHYTDFLDSFPPVGELPKYSLVGVPPSSWPEKPFNPLNRENS
ncbi:hypothetical protein [Halocynthiibacter sp. C4]|uniref:hypothetical protein n=1 Tax=Halocynthiibacter sp. C4 TaxID=2992758 RepID=UPI00237B5EB8|nr:hypothetical protein [Halocynthiibacter sp. C4]